MAFAQLVRKRVGPFFQAAFPGKQRIRVLIDSEPLLHTDDARAAFAAFGIEALPERPKYSPDLNPQENVWGWVEQALRKEEKKSDTFKAFCTKLLRVARRYPSAQSLVGSMQQRLAEVVAQKGAMTKY